MTSKIAYRRIKIIIVDTYKHINKYCINAADDCIVADDCINSDDSFIS